MRTRCLTTSAAAAMLFLAALFLQPALSEAKTYTVRKGDNLHDIAKKNHVSLEELSAANQVSPKGLKPGMKLAIPEKNTPTGGKSAKKASAPSRTRGKTVAVTASDQAKSADPDTQTYHTVRKGENLSSIARSHSLSPAELKELNQLSSNKLRAGQRLIVGKADSPRTYTVKKGDNLRQIARRFNMTADDLMEINELESQDIRAGQKLQLEVWFDPEPQEPETREKAAKNIEEELRTLTASEDFKEIGLQDRVTTFARKFINIPYKFGGNGIFGIDCSAYVKKVYGLLGMDLPRTAREQFKEGEIISREDLSVGDLVFFRTYASFPSHVGIYLGNNLFIHASSKGKKVTVDNLDAPYYLKRFIGAKRLLTDASAKSDIDG